MKISVSWILDHIKVPKEQIDVPVLVKQLNATTAEIEGFETIKTDLSTLFLARVTGTSGDSYTLECPELRTTLTLNHRTDGAAGAVFLVKKESAVFRYALLSDVGSGKEGVMAPVFVEESELKGTWKNSFEIEDHILHIDNKALTNRPDLWGHRGFAREVAALLGKELIPEEQLLAAKSIKHYDFSAPGNGSFAIEIAQNQLCGQPCKRFAAVYLPTVEFRPSLLKMATRLARIDARPLDALVDMTNYVMFDVGQPMHAYDAGTLPTKKLVARCATEGDKLTLIDGQEVLLVSNDCVITDGERPVALAGIMGGRDTAVQKTTTSLLLESANFDATMIRRTATRLKMRTEASSRFEKSLDPNQNTTALLRYLKLLDDAQIPYTAVDTITSLGPLIQEKTIELTHERIEKKIGMPVSKEKVETILTRLGFGVAITKNGDYGYRVTVPTIRSSKDVTLPEDIIEEVARFVGYSSIPLVFPKREMKAFDIASLERLRALKKMLAYGLEMHETQTYAFFDEEFLHKLGYEPVDALRIANPLSEHWQRLVTSLVPNLLKGIVTNATTETVRLFECNRVWFMEEIPVGSADESRQSPQAQSDALREGAVEEFECVGLWYEAKKKIDFYEGKELVQRLFDMLHIDVRFKKPADDLEPWYNKNQTAELFYNDRIIGRAGMIAEPFLSTIAEGQAFVFELDAAFLLNVKSEKGAYKPLKKYPPIDLDVSLLVPITATVTEIEMLLKKADSRIMSAQLIDSFEKPEWGNKKSLTFRFTAYNPEGTFTKEEIDALYQQVVQQLTATGAEVR